MGSTFLFMWFFLKKFILGWVWWFFITTTTLFGQKQLYTADTTTQRVKVVSLQAGMQLASVFAHSEDVQNTAGSKPLGVELAYTWQRRDKEVIDLCNCYPRKGIVVSLFNFDNGILGSGAMAGWMLEPVWHLGSRLELNIRGIAGGAWLSNPFDSVKNPTNQSYSTDLSAWLGFGLGLSYAITPNWRLQALANFQHTSNGGLKQPNKGINMPAAGILLQYTPQPKPFYRGPRAAATAWRQQPWEKELTAFVTAKRGEITALGSVRQPIAGVQFGMHRHVSRLSMVGGGLEAYYDGYTKSRMKNDDLPDQSALRIALMAGHTFVLGRVGFSQQLGIYLYKPAPFDDAWFHRWGLHYNWSKHWKVGFNLKAHRHIADFIDLRVGYRW